MHFHGGAHVHFDLAHGARRWCRPASGHAHRASEQLSLSISVRLLPSWHGSAATGYLLTRYSAVDRLRALHLSRGGIFGTSIIFFFVAKVLMIDSHLDPADYDMVGVLGTVIVPIREGGTGEIVFSQEGSRRCAGARSDNAGAIPRALRLW